MRAESLPPMAATAIGADVRAHAIAMVRTWSHSAQRLITLTTWPASQLAHDIACFVATQSDKH
ncbi:hypothetical protein XaFJ1_GM003185 [Xanthomonas albilineans]|nr:hypothetical protein XaFJ1_GM003185 [Xanthomonas albilineans]